MNIALIGATGYVGSALLEELLSRGHQVHALVRDPAKLAARPGLHAVPVDATQPDAVAAALRNSDALISAFNPGWGNPNLFDEFLRGSDAIAAGAAQAGKRLLVVGGAGSLYVAPGVQLVDTPEFPEQWKTGALAAREALKRLQSNNLGLDWTFLSPPAHLVPGARTGTYRVGGDELMVDAQGHSGISVTDLAVALVDELEQPRHAGRRFTVAY